MFFQTDDHNWVNFDTVRRISFFEREKGKMMAFIYFAQPEFFEGKCVDDPDIKISGRYAEKLCVELQGDHDG